jgi:hypothetical protein
MAAVLARLILTGLSQLTLYLCWFGLPIIRSLRASSGREPGLALTQLSTTEQRFRAVLAVQAGSRGDMPNGAAPGLELGHRHGGWQKVALGRIHARKTVTIEVSAGMLHIECDDGVCVVRALPSWPYGRSSP